MLSCPVWSFGGPVSQSDGSARCAEEQTSLVRLPFRGFITRTYCTLDAVSVHVCTSCTGYQSPLARCGGPLFVIPNDRRSAAPAALPRVAWLFEASAFVLVMTTL